MKDILIVEDGLQERERLVRLFTEAGYSVQSFATVGEAERFVQQEAVRAAILDIGLSDKSGSYLFSQIKRGGRVAYILIFTGNPSVHLKQRFLNEGAVDYIVKGSPQAQNESFLARIKELLGAPQRTKSSKGIPLATFLHEYVTEASRKLFLDLENNVPSCTKCSSQEYLVAFDHVPQAPPEVHGRVVCASCGHPMEGDIG